MLKGQKRGGVVHPAAHGGSDARKLKMLKLVWTPRGSSRSDTPPPDEKFVEDGQNLFLGK